MALISLYRINLFSSVFPDGDGIGVYQDEQKTMDKFRRLSEVDAETWEKLVQEFKEVSTYYCR